MRSASNRASVLVGLPGGRGGHRAGARRLEFLAKLWHRDVFVAGMAGDRGRACLNGLDRHDSTVQCGMYKSF